MPRMMGEMLIHRECRLLPDIRMLVIPVQKARVLGSIAVCRHVGAVVTLIVYHFTASVVEHMVGCFAALRGFVFLF